MVAVLVAATLSPQVGFTGWAMVLPDAEHRALFLALTPWEEVQGAGDGEHQDSKLTSQICNRQVLPCTSRTEMKAHV